MAGRSHAPLFKLPLTDWRADHLRRFELALALNNVDQGQEILRSWAEQLRDELSQRIAVEEVVDPDEPNPRRLKKLAKLDKQRGL